MLRLGLDPERPHDGDVACALDSVVEQRRLADSGFATHEERSAAPAPAAQQQLVDAGTGGVPTDEHAFTVAPLTSVNKPTATTDRHPARQRFRQRSLTVTAPPATFGVASR